MLEPYIVPIFCGITAAVLFAVVGVIFLIMGSKKNIDHPFGESPLPYEDEELEPGPEEDEPEPEDEESDEETEPEPEDEVIDLAPVSSEDGNVTFLPLGNTEGILEGSPGDYAKEITAAIATWIANNPERELVSFQVIALPESNYIYPEVEGIFIVSRLK